MTGIFNIGTGHNSLYVPTDIMAVHMGGRTSGVMLSCESGQVFNFDMKDYQLEPDVLLRNIRDNGIDLVSIPKRCAAYFATDRDELFLHVIPQKIVYLASALAKDTSKDMMSVRAGIEGIGEIATFLSQHELAVITGAVRDAKKVETFSLSGNKVMFAGRSPGNGDNPSLLLDPHAMTQIHFEHGKYGAIVFSGHVPPLVIRDNPSDIQRAIEKIRQSISGESFDIRGAFDVAQVRMSASAAEERTKNFLDKVAKGNPFLMKVGKDAYLDPRLPHIFSIHQQNGKFQLQIHPRHDLMPQYRRGATIDFDAGWKRTEFLKRFEENQKSLQHGKRPPHDLSAPPSRRTPPSPPMPRRAIK